MTEYKIIETRWMSGHRFWIWNTLWHVPNAPAHVTQTYICLN